MTLSVLIYCSVFSDNVIFSHSAWTVAFSIQNKGEEEERPAHRCEGCGKLLGWFLTVILVDAFFLSLFLRNITRYLFSAHIIWFLLLHCCCFCNIVLLLTASNLLWKKKKSFVEKRNEAYNIWKDYTTIANCAMKDSVIILIFNQKFDRDFRKRVLIAWSGHNTLICKLVWSPGDGVWFPPVFIWFYSVVLIKHERRRKRSF